MKTPDSVRIGGDASAYEEISHSYLLGVEGLTVVPEISRDLRQEDNSVKPPKVVGAVEDGFLVDHDGSLEDQVRCVTTKEGPCRFLCPESEVGFMVGWEVEKVDIHKLYLAGGAVVTADSGQDALSHQGRDLAGVRGAGPEYGNEVRPRDRDHERQHEDADKDGDGS